VDVDEAADRLYALPPEEFTAERDTLAKQADGDARKAIKALRRPTVSAYVVNRVVRAHPAAVDDLLAVGDDLRAAMTGGGDVRGLTEQRRTSVGDLVRAASAAAQRDLTAAVEQEVAATFEAATADPALGDAVRSGRLVKPLRYAGFGTLPDLDDVVATPVPPRRRAAARPEPRDHRAARPERRPQNQDKRADDEQRKRDQELTRLRDRVLELSGAADDAQRRYEEASARARQARELLASAEQERAEAHRAASAAHREAEKVRRELGRLERR
jgi:hypothetical protein